MSDETFVMQVGDRLREAREALGLTQADLADRAGVTRVQWGRYERGIGVPGGEVLARAAGAGVDVRYVITGSRDYDPPPALSAEEHVLLRHWREASPATRKAALGALIGASPASPSVLVTGPVGQHIHGDVHQRDISFFGKKRK